MSKRFHLGDVLTITTDLLVSPRHVAGVYDILNYMTGDNLFTHQLPRAGRVCAPELLRQFPQLADTELTVHHVEALQGYLAALGETPTKDQAAGLVMVWLEHLTWEYGEWFDVEPLPPGVWEHQDALAELAAMRPDTPIIAVSVPEQSTKEAGQ